MTRMKRVASLLLVFACSVLCESASGIEIFVTVEMTTGTFPLGKVTIDGSNLTYQEIAPIDPTNATAYENLTWSETANGFYSTGFNGPSAKNTFATVTQAATAATLNNDMGYYLGLSTDMLNDTLYGYRYDVNEFGTINKANGAFSPIGSSGVVAIGNPGQMTFANSKFYMATTIDTGGNITSNFGSIDKATGAFTNIRTDNFFNDMVLASDGVTIYAIKSQGFQVYTIDPTNGVETLIGTPTGTTNVWRFFGASTTVPEPGTYCLAGFASFVLAFTGKRKLRRSHA